MFEIENSAKWVSNALYGYMLLSQKTKTKVHLKKEDLAFFIYCIMK